jgi:hypothetical protein
LREKKIVSCIKVTNFTEKCELNIIDVLKIRIKKLSLLKLCMLVFFLSVEAKIFVFYNFTF